MPLHDWTRVPSGLFHDFHQSWTVRIKDALNAGRLPRGLSALVEQRSGRREADVLTIERSSVGLAAGPDEGGGLLTRERPTTSIVRQTSNAIYAGRANRIVIKHHLGRIVAVIEVVSPGNKDSRAALRDFVAKAVEFLQQGIHFLVVDLFPPTARDPQGLHKVIWDEVHEEDFAFPLGKDRILASCEMGSQHRAFVEPVAVGDTLREMPLFVASGLHIPVPLEPTYMAAWEASPQELRKAVETGVIPENGDEE